MSLQDYYKEFMQEIYLLSGTHQNFTESEFTRLLCEMLIEHATIQEYTIAGYKNSSKGIRVDAWDYNDELEVLSLIITDFRFNSDLETLTNSEVTRNFRRVEKFFLQCRKDVFLSALEESAQGYDLAHTINSKEKRDKISRIEFILLTNCKLSERVHTIDSKQVEGYACSYDVWDIGRLCRLESSGKVREDVIINFEEFVPDGIPCLSAFTKSEKFASYLLAMPGDIVAGLYEKYGERLLEQNVRTFLQFRGKVNKGIRATIQNEPEMFFAYNNGLTATAEHVETSNEGDNIKSVTNLQIVNGGQTTASIFTARKKDKADLSNVFVQIKLTVIEPEKVDEVVPKISEFANTQNKVSGADFSSNHPFHLRMEEMSRRLWAPSQTGSLLETHWFYERARGQYLNAQANLTKAEKKQFLLQNPRKQMFTKTDLAKFEHSYEMLPNLVSLGAQKNFSKYANVIGQKWEKNESQFNQLYFRNVVAKAIIFRFLDRNIMKQKWYGGYKINIVAYSIAKLVEMVSKTGNCLDLERIWKDQALSSDLKFQLLSIADFVNKHIQDTPPGIKNVTEWCKKDVCWTTLRDKPIPLDEDVLSILIDPADVDYMKKEAEKSQKEENGIFAQKYVVEKGADYWKTVADFGLSNKLLGPKEAGVLETACAIPAKIPSDKQSAILIKIEKKLQSEGLYIDNT